MTHKELPYRATTQETCDWLGDQTGTRWNLVKLLENGLIPSVWLDYSSDYPELFAGGEAGFYAPVMFAGDTQRLIAGSDDVVISFTKDADKIALALKPPGICRPLDELRFFRWDVEKLLKLLNQPVAAKDELIPVLDDTPKESQLGISKEQVISAFAALVKIDLDKALTAATGIFGDEGARVKSSTKKAKSKIVWNPVTLALGLNDAYKVPMPYLKRAFNSHAFLREWRDNWEATLDLLGE